MWTCAVCTKSIEDEEAACYHCGSPRGLKSNAAAAIKEKVVAKRRVEIESSPENLDKFYELDRTRYTRNWFALFSRMSIRHAIGFYLFPIFGLCLIADPLLHISQGLTRMDAESMLGGVVVIALSTWYIHEATKVYPLKRRDDVAPAKVEL
jgi:hypothetical protein